MEDFIITPLEVYKQLKTLNVNLLAYTPYGTITELSITNFFKDPIIDLKQFLDDPSDKK